MIISKKHRKLVLNLKDPERITAVIPGAKLIQYKGRTLVAVKHALDEVRVLRNMGLDAPAPMGSYYDWPGRYKPYAHQKVCAEFLTMNPRAFNLSGMGSGKTVTTLWAFDYLKKAGLVKRMLIISPLSTLERAWGDEIFRHFPELTFTVLHGSRDKRHKLIANDFDIYIINHDGIKSPDTLKLLAQKEGLDLVVIDECFPAGTLVSTPSGNRAIETLNIGDLVTSSWGPKPITHVFKKLTNRMVEVEFENGQKLKCTPEHPFATDRGWISAKDLAGRLVLSERGLCQLRSAFHQAGEPIAKASEVLLQKLLFGELRKSPSDGQLPDVSVGFYEEAVEPKSVLLQSVCEHRSSDGSRRSDKNLQSLQQSVLCATVGGGISPSANLLPQMFHNVQVDSQRGRHARRLSKDSSEAARATVLEQGYPHTKGGSGKNCGTAEIDEGAVHERSRREWNRNVAGGVLGSVGAAGQVRVQPSDTNEAETGQRVSDVLQGGFWGCGGQDSGGGGRLEPQHVGTPGAGHEKSGVPANTRVARVTHIELESPEPVWNLEVAGPHDYVAGGHVVHNCAVFRTPGTERFKALNVLINGSEKQGFPVKKWAWGLTGTPIPNAPTDAWAQIRLISPSRVPRYFGSFRDTVMRQVTPFKWQDRDGAIEQVHAVMQPAIRFAREDCIDLPPTTYVTRQCELSPEQKAAFDEMVKQLKAEVSGGQITAINEAVKLSKLLQICSGVAYSEGGEVVLPAGPRIALLKEIIAESESKVLVFVPFTGALKAVAAELSKDYTVEVVYGGVSKTQRDQIFKDFQSAKNPHVLVADARTMSHGLSFTAASTTIWYGPTTSNETYMQANERTARPGQRLNTLIVNIESTPLERKMYDRLANKGKTQGILLDMLKGA